MSENLFFKMPFAINGDRQEIPVDMDKTGAISFETGWGFDYERDPQTDANAKDVGRLDMNELFFKVTSVLRQYQTQGAYPFITPEHNGGVPFPYPKAARCLYDDGTGVALYESLKDVNTATPDDTTSWRRVYDVWLEKAKQDVLEVIKKAGIEANLEEVDQLYEAIQKIFTSNLATETSMGIAQYATVEEHIEGKVSNRIVNPAGLAARWGGALGTTGWQRLPSGLLLQWGTIATGQEGMYIVTFPVAFTEACFGFTGTCAAPHAVDIHLTEGYLIIRDITNTQALVWQEWNVSEHGHPSAFYWFALGV